MQDREYHDSVLLDLKEDRVRKPRDESTPHFTMHGGEPAGELLDRVERRIDSSEELFSQTGPLFLVPGVGSSQILADASALDDRQCHRPSASTGVGQHLLSRDHIVRGAGVFSKALVDDGAVCFAQRNRRRLGGNTGPDQLDQTQPLFDGKLEDFRDVRVTHADGNLPPL